MNASKTQVKVIKQNLGVDISKDDFKVCFFYLDSNGKKFIKGSRTFKNTFAGFQAFIKWIEKKRIAELAVCVTVEATGVYHENLVHFLNSKNYSVSVVLPNQSKAYAKSLNLKTKTDKVDAKMLGQFGIERDLIQWEPGSPKMREIKQLTRERENLLGEKVALSNKIHALNYSFEANKSVLKRKKARLKMMKKHLQDVEKEIEKTIAEDEILNNKVEKITKIKGVGVITVASLIAETNGFKLFTSLSQLISYAGYDVVERESGSSIKGKTRISKKGNSRIRRALHFPAISAVKHEPAFKQLFERILGRSFIKMKAYVAVQRKLLVLVYTLYKNDTVYDQNYLENPKRNSLEKDRQETSPAYCG